MPYLSLERDHRLDFGLPHTEQVAQVDCLAIVRDLELGCRSEALWDELGCRAGDKLGVAQGLGQALAMRLEGGLDLLEGRCDCLFCCLHLELCCVGVSFVDVVVSLLCEN